MRRRRRGEQAGPALRDWPGEKLGMSAFASRTATFITPISPSHQALTRSGRVAAAAPLGRKEGDEGRSNAMTSTKTATDEKRPQKGARCLRHRRSTTQRSSWSSPPTRGTWAAHGRKSHYWSSPHRRKVGTDSGKPVAYLSDDSRYFVWAANGGAPQHPGWYHILEANPSTTIEVGGETIDVVAKAAPSTGHASGSSGRGAPIGTRNFHRPGQSQGSSARDTEEQPFGRNPEGQVTLGVRGRLDSPA